MMQIFFLTYVMIIFKIADRVQEGMRELDVLKEKRDINLCATMALMLAHKKSPSIGKFSHPNIGAHLLSQNAESP